MVPDVALEHVVNVRVCVVIQHIRVAVLDIGVVEVGIDAGPRAVRRLVRSVFNEAAGKTNLRICDLERAAVHVHGRLGREVLHDQVVLGQREERAVSRILEGDEVTVNALVASLEVDADRPAAIGMLPPLEPVGGHARTGRSAALVHDEVEAMRPRRERDRSVCRPCPGILLTVVQHDLVVDLEIDEVIEVLRERPSDSLARAIPDVPVVRTVDVVVVVIQILKYLVVVGDARLGVLEVRDDEQVVVRSRRERGVEVSVLERRVETGPAHGLVLAGQRQLRVQGRDVVRLSLHDQLSGGIGRRAERAAGERELSGLD